MWAYYYAVDKTAFFYYEYSIIFESWVCLPPLGINTMLAMCESVVRIRIGDVNADFSLSVSYCILL